MKKFEFVLTFALPLGSAEPEQHVKELAEAGCDDALVGIGQTGYIALDFCRDAETAREALGSAVRDIERAIPKARFVEARPDLVGVSEVANVMGFSRQNMRKLIRNHPGTFPPPVHDGHAALWHLTDVLDWFEQVRKQPASAELRECAFVARLLNHARECAQLNALAEGCPNILTKGLDDIYEEMHSRLDPVLQRIQGASMKEDW